MKTKTAARIRAELREGLAIGRRHAEDVARAGTNPTPWWTTHSPRHTDTPYTHGCVSGFKQAYKGALARREEEGKRASEQVLKAMEKRHQLAVAHAKAEQERIDREARDPDLSFMQVYTQGAEVRVTTYSGGERYATILVDPDRAESLGHQFLTEAARARSKRNGAEHGSTSGGRREQQRLGETG